MLRKVILIFTSSILLSLSFSSYDLSFLAWIGLVPLFIALGNNTLRQAFFISYACGVLFFIFSMYWLFHATSAGWIILSLYQGLYFGIFGLFFYAILGSTHGAVRTARYLLIACTWCLLEYMRATFFGGIGWNLLGHSQHGQLPVIQIADITGVYGVSFLVVLVNLSVFSAVSMATCCRARGKGPFSHTVSGSSDKTNAHTVFEILAVFFTVIVILLYGLSQLRQFAPGAGVSAGVKVSAIQGNIKQLHKWDSRYRDYILAKYKGLTVESARSRPDLIIWPETSIPGYLNKDPQLMRYMEILANETGIPILAGAPMAGINAEKEDVEFNSAVMFSDNGRVLQRYDKLHLVMFGEFIPFERYLPGIRGFLPITGHFVPGDEYILFKLDDTPGGLNAEFGTLICFEDIFPRAVRRFVKEGADFMVNITNDAWFGKSAAAYQHAANSIFRSVENRRPFIRCTNTGISCFIDRTGRIYNQLASCGGSLFIEGHITDTISVYSALGHTFYTKHGDVFILSCLIILAFFSGCFVIDYICYRKYNN
jgi:apolipoprotein N-acyltransferase